MPAAQAATHPRVRTSLQRVLQHSTLYAFGNIAGRVVAFLAIPFYSRFLSPAEYGLLELIELSTQTIAIAFGLQAVGAALTRLFHDQGSKAAEQSVVSTALIGTAMLSVGVTVASVAAAGAISRAVFHTDAWTTLLQAAFVAMCFASMVEVVLVYERMRDNARFFLAYSLVTLAVNLGLNILFIGALGAGVWGFVSSKLVVSAAGAAFLLWRLRRDVGWHWRGAYVPEFVRFGAPLVLSGICYFAVHFSDRFFLTAAVPLADLGRYALAYRLAMMVNVLIGDSFAKSWNVSLYRHSDEAGWREQFARVFAYLAFALSTTGMAIAVFGPELLSVMVPAAFMPAALLLPVLVLAYVLRDVADFFRSLLLINKRAVWVGKIAFAAAVANLLLNIALIPAYGVHGAAWATLLTWSAYLAVCWIVADREHRLPIPVAPYGALLGAMVAVYAAAAVFRVHGFLLQALLDGIWVTVFAGVAALILRSEAGDRTLTRWLGGLLAQALVPDAPEWPRSNRAGRHVLMLAYDFPSQNQTGAARPSRFARYMRRLGMPVTVVCSSSTQATAGIQATAGQGKPVYEPSFVTPASRVYGLTPDGLGAGPESATIRVPDPARTTRRRKAISRGLKVLERLLLPHHDRLAWLPHGCAAASAAMTPGTVVISTHPPVVTHLVGLALKRRLGRPWIADFRDPLWGNPGRASSRAGLLDPMIERLVIEQADAVIANTDASAAILVRRYPAFSAKVSTIWNGFDPEDNMEPLPRIDRAQRFITHVGSLYGTRTPLPFVACLNRLIASGAILPSALQFRQIGQSDPNCFDLAAPACKALQDRGCLHAVTGALTAIEARQEILRADWLLLLDVDQTNPGLQVPARTFEYLRACRPILALTTPNSPMARVLARSGVIHLCVDLASSPEQFDAKVLAFLQPPFTDTAPSPQFWAEFDGSRQTAALNALIDRVCAETAQKTAEAAL